MALQGTLDTFSLTDVLTLLASTRKSGRLWVDDNHRSGSLWLLDGTVVAAGMDDHLDQEPVSVLFELLRSIDGAFLFEADIPGPYTEPGEDMADVLARAHQLHQEWVEITAVVPSTHRLVTLVAELTTPEVTIDAARWRVLVAVGAGGTVAHLGAALGLTDIEACRVVKDTIEAGLVELGDEDLDEAADDLQDGYHVEEDDAEGGPYLDDEIDAIEDEAPVGWAVLPAPVEESGDLEEPSGPLEAWDQGPIGIEPGDEPADVYEPFAPYAAEEPEGPAGPVGPVGPAIEEPVAWSGWNPLAPSAPTGLEEAWASDGAAVTNVLSFPSPLPPPASLQEAIGGFGRGHEDPGAELGELTPQAARAIAAAAQASTEAERDAALAEAVDHDNEPLDRGLLLRFLSSVKQ